MPRKYTVEEIKRAFWKEFHKSGENWFNYLDDEKTNNESTNAAWLDFLENLEEPDSRNNRHNEQE